MKNNMDQCQDGVNGVAPNKAAIKYDLNDGDQVVWYYVNYN